jgi:hypothetical protein
VKATGGAQLHTANRYGAEDKSDSDGKLEAPDRAIKSPMHFIGAASPSGTLQRLSNTESSRLRGLFAGDSTGSMQAFASFSSKISKVKAGRRYHLSSPRNLESLQEAARFPQGSKAQNVSKSLNVDKGEGATKGDGTADRDLDRRDHDSLKSGEGGHVLEESTHGESHNRQPLKPAGPGASNPCGDVQAGKVVTVTGTGLQPVAEHQLATSPGAAGESARRSREGLGEAGEVRGEGGEGDGASFSRHVELVSRQRMAWCADAFGIFYRFRTISARISHPRTRSAHVPDKEATPRRRRYFRTRVYIVNLVLLLGLCLVNAHIVQIDGSPEPFGPRHC